MIELRDVSKFYGGFAALSDITLMIPRGEIVAVVGPNGAGKSTLLHCILGITPYQGQIRVAGLDPRRDGKQVRSLIGYMPQSSGLHDDLTVAQTLQFYCELRNASFAAAARLLREVRLDPFEEAAVRQLSGGMRQRLAFAVACLNDPPILFLDEPSSGIDGASHQLVIERLVARAAAGATVVLATHLTQDLLRVADRFVVLAEGKVSGVLASAPDLDFFFAEA